MTDEQKLPDAIVAVEYGEFVKSLLDQVDAGEMTLRDVLARLAGDQGKESSDQLPVTAMSRICF